MKKTLLLTLCSLILVILIVLTPGYLSYFSLLYRHNIDPVIVERSVALTNEIFNASGGDVSAEDLGDFRLSDLKGFWEESQKILRIEGLSANMRTIRYYVELRDDPEGKNLLSLIRRDIAADYLQFSNAENKEDIKMIEGIENLAQEDSELKDLINKLTTNTSESNWLMQ